MAIDPREITLSDEQRRELARVADQSGKPWEEVFAEALGSYRRQGPRNETGEDESLYHSLQRHGLIGCIKGGPPDLSTNPKYMEGFGESDNETGSS
jgi:hypothetical protein